LRRFANIKTDALLFERYIFHHVYSNYIVNETGSKMQYTEFNTSEDLSELVKYYWLLEFKNESPHFIKVLPHGCPEVVITVSGGVVIKEQEASTVPQSVFVGYRMKAIDFECAPYTCLAGIRFKPFTAINKDVLLKEDRITAEYKIYNLHLKQSLIERLQAIQNDQIACISVLDEICNNLIEKRHYFNPHVNNLQKSNSHPVTRISDITALTSLCERQIQKLFRKYYDITPKEYLRINRLLKVIEAVNSNGGKPLQTIITESGYCDQAHFCNEFKKTAGITCKEYFSKNKLVEGKTSIIT
jgi:AraC-like DNA-binding protein